MIRRSRYLTLFPIVALAGCGAIKADLKHPGGIVGQQLDQRFFNVADSKRAQLLRATMIAALSSRIANGSLKDAADAEAYLKRLDGVRNELNFLAGDLGDDSSHANCAASEIQTDCETRASLFESHLPQMEYGLGGLLIAALPRREGAELAGAVTQGNIMSAAWKLLKLATRSTDGAHRGAAAYRSAIEILKLNCTAAVKSDQACLGMANDADWKKMVIKMTDVPPGDIRFFAFYDMMRISCMQLPLGQDSGDMITAATARKSDCQKLKWEPKARYGGLTLP